MSYSATYEFPLDELGEYLRERVRTRLGTELELVTCEQGTYGLFPADLPIVQQVPAVFVEFVKANPTTTGRKPFRVLEGPIRFWIWFVRAIGDDEHPTRPTVQALAKILKEFNRDELGMRDFVHPGFEVQFAEANEAELAPIEDEESEELFLSAGYVQVEITARHKPTAG